MHKIDILPPPPNKRYNYRIILQIMFRCFKWVVSKKQPSETQDSLIYYYDIIHKNKSCDHSCNFTEIDYYTTLSKTRSIQKKIPGRRIHV
uniref:Uncharacterized protein n=1 Tax=viral metagenome TaxID=1070528 RepID=A0A6C0D5Y6_9ZZZZ